MKLAAILALLFVISLVFAPSTQAAFLTITSDGGVFYNVLAFDSENFRKDIIPAIGAVVSLAKKDDQVKLRVASDEQEYEANVTAIKDDIIEIENKFAPHKITIGPSGEEFVIRQNMVAATTSFPITVDSKSKKLSVQTLSGMRYIEILPIDVIDILVKSGIIDQNEEIEKTLELVEGETGELEYKLDAQKSINVFNLVALKAPLKLEVSATNGKVLSVDEPVWFKVLGVLFT